MGIFSKTADTAGGTAVGAVKGGVMGALLPIVAGAAIMAGVIVAGAAIGGALFGAGAIATVFSGSTAAIAGMAALAGAVTGGVLGSGPMAAIGAVSGGVMGGAKRLGSSKEPEVALDQQLAAEQQRANLLKVQSERQNAASSFNNPDANGGFVAKTQTTTTTTKTASNEPNYAQRA